MLTFTFLALQKGSTLDPIDVKLVSLVVTLEEKSDGNPN